MMNSYSPLDEQYGVIAAFFSLKSVFGYLLPQDLLTDAKLDSNKISYESNDLVLVFGTAGAQFSTRASQHTLKFGDNYQLLESNTAIIMI